MNIKAILDRFEGDKAVFSSDLGEILIPRLALAKTIHEGSVCYIALRDREAEEKKQEQNAKDLLNELLSDEGNKER